MASHREHEEKVKYLFVVRPDPGQIGQIETLYRAAGWWTDEDDSIPGRARRIVSGSHCFVVAIKEEEIVGMGRAISDRASDAYIQDVIVKESFRRKGIATRIVKLIMKRLEEDGISWIGLIAVKDSDDLYRKLGFKEISSRVPMSIDGC
ncbi:MAG: GNAT family N-acetyltransferase [Syntrophales bacterium]